MEISDLTIVEFDLTQRSLKTLSVDTLNLNQQNPNLIYWIHCNLNTPELFNQIAQKIKLPENVIQACQHEDAIPKLIDADETLTLQVECLSPTEINQHSEMEFNNLIIYLTDQFCFTGAIKPISVLSEFIKSAHKALRFAKTPCFILFLILDSVVNDYARALFNFEIITENIDLQVRHTQSNIYSEIINLKQQVMKIKRNAIAVREILMRTSGRNIPVISEQCRASLYNLSNHGQMVVYEADTIRDMLNSFLDQIDNALMQKMNATIRVLTAFAAIFLPLSLITGIYGMNFHWIPELEWKYGYFWALGLLVVCAALMLWVFKRKKWF